MDLRPAQVTLYHGVVLAVPIRAQPEARWRGVDINSTQTDCPLLGLHPGTGDSERGLKVVKESLNSQRDTETLIQTWNLAASLE